MDLRKWLINLAGRVQNRWREVNFDDSPIELAAGWYITEFNLPSSVPHTPCIVVEEASGNLATRELIGAHASRNRMLIYLPSGRLHSVSEILDFERLARVPWWEGRARILLISGRYLINFPNPVALIKMIFLQFKSPAKLSTALLKFYTSASADQDGYLQVFDFYQRFPQLVRWHEWRNRHINVAVVIESSAQRKALKELLVPPNTVLLANESSTLADDVDYVLPLAESEHLRDVSLMLLKKAIRKASKHKTNAHPLLVYSDHDYQFDRSLGHHPMEPAFKPAPSTAYLHCFAYIGPAVAYHRSAVETQSIETLFNLESSYPLQIKLFSDLDRILHVPEVLISSEQQTGLKTPAPTTLESAWPDIEWRAMNDDSGGAGNKLIASKVWSEKPSVELIIPTRDGLNVLKPCVDSILAKTEYPNFAITIVDNGSVEPATHDYFASFSKEDRVKILPYPGEFNYSAINNFAAAATDADYIGLINNDIEVIEGDWLTQMMVWAKQPEVGAVGAKLLFGNGLVQHAGVMVGMGNAAGHIHRLEPRDSAGYQNRCIATQNMSAVTAACLVTPRALFERLGGLNEKQFKVAYNDIDYCLRVRELDYQVIWTPQAELYHHESVSRGDDLSEVHIDRYFKELRQLQRRWKTKGYVDPFYSKHLRVGDEGVYPRISTHGKHRLRKL